jgi:two-component system NtrC family sensor kinase
LPADLNEAVERTLVITRGEYKHVAEVRLELGELPRVRCHVGDIQQVLVNLMINASHAIEAKAAERGSRGRIVVKTWVAHHDGAADEIVISITDDGGGIPPEIQPRVFEAFFTTKELGRGTGQGLAISRSIVVDRHGGSIDFETEPGKGTTFHVRLPVL